MKLFTELHEVADPRDANATTFAGPSAIMVDLQMVNYLKDFGEDHGKATLISFSGGGCIFVTEPPEYIIRESKSTSN